VLETHVRANIQADGGDVEFYDFDHDNGHVWPLCYVPSVITRTCRSVSRSLGVGMWGMLGWLQLRLRLKGACVSCASSTVTVRFMIKNVLQHYVDGIEEVSAVDIEEDSQDDWIG
jgi:Fe-S cluster biogenesis protein NfuA